MITESLTPKRLIAGVDVIRNVLNHFSLAKLMVENECTGKKVIEFLTRFYSPTRKRKLKIQI
jgi:hypothetical protein